MLYHVPSGSKSPASGFLTGLARWYALRSAIIVHVPSGLTRATPEGMDVTACEQPPLATSAYIAPSMKSMSATPSASPRPLTARGKLAVTVVLEPLASILEILAPVGADE